MTSSGMNDMASIKVKLIEVEDISTAWRSSHITFLVFAALFGMSSGIIISLMMDEHGLLCSKIYLETTDQAGPDVIQLNETLVKVIPTVTYAGSCEYSQYTFISSFIFGSIWMVFFMMCGPGGKADSGLPQPWRIVFPALIFCTTYCLVTVGAGAQLTMAIDETCSNFDYQLARIRNRTSSEKCLDLDLFYQVKAIKYLRVQTLMLIAEILSWLCCASWGISAAVCILRVLLAPDFRPSPVPREPRPQGSTVSYEPLISSSRHSGRNYPVNEPRPSTSKAWIHNPPDDENLKEIAKPAVEVSKVQFKEGTKQKQISQVLRRHPSDGNKIASQSNRLENASSSDIPQVLLVVTDERLDSPKKDIGGPTPHDSGTSDQNVNKPIVDVTGIPTELIPIGVDKISSKKLQ